MHKEQPAKDAKSKSKNKSREKDKGKEVPRTAEGDRLVDEVMDAFLSGLGKGDVETNVFDTTVCPFLCCNVAFLVFQVQMRTMTGALFAGLRNSRGL